MGVWMTGGRAERPGQRSVGCNAHTPAGPQTHAVILSLDH